MARIAVYSTAYRGDVPSVVMPSIFDQVWHARRQEQISTGIHVPRARHLNEAIPRLISDTSMTKHATNLAKQLATLNGVTMTTQRIEDFLCPGQLHRSVTP